MQDQDQDQDQDRDRDRDQREGSTREPSRAGAAVQHLEADLYLVADLRPEPEPARDVRAATPANPFARPVVGRDRRRPFDSLRRRELRQDREAG